MLNTASLDDKYALNEARAYITGIEALVRLTIVQRQRDAEAGLNTAGFVSGYRGSPLGSLDQAMWRARPWLDRHHIKFQPGVNEDLAATAIWGTQQVNLLPGAKYDGVFSMWYGKGPGVDRSMDVIKHANLYGTTAHGGVLAVAGDDHACKSSTAPQQSEHMFIGASIPVLSPANVQEVLDYGIIGWALSRYSGCWVALKAITENMDAALSADLDPHRVRIELPQNAEIPPGGLNAQWPTTPLEQERLLHRYRIYAARAFAFANHLNQVTHDSPEPRLGIVTAGKSHMDVLEALDELGIDEALARDIGIRIFKVGMSWPLEPISLHQFARGLQEILVVEEKRSVIEDQITGQLYNWPVAERPIVVGEFDEHGHSLVTNLGELTPTMVARAIGDRIRKFYDSHALRERLQFLADKEARLATAAPGLTRIPYFCSGCPHNTSTKVPDGSIGLAGIGCHYMAKWMNRNTETFTQMGGEGASWIGQAPFTETRHVFQNLGDGTYFHSGLLAIRASIAAGVNITYKLLYNDAVAMTGGQPVDGTLTLSNIAGQLLAEGVVRLAVVAEDAARARQQLAGISGLTVHERADFDRLQLEFRELSGCSVIIYDQTCAAEKRRRRKRGLMPESPTRVFIHPDVCEGCGDCSHQSNCLSVLPKKTELGVKRQIDQNGCNRDFSCLKGFCPSFVTVTGGTLKPPVAQSRERLANVVALELPQPQPINLDRPWNILVTGVGGSGVLTVGSLVAMAAHLEGKGCSTLNQTGLAQKFGAVVSHVKVARRQQDIHAVGIADGCVDLMLGCDLVVAAMPAVLMRLAPNRSHSVINTFENPTADFIQNEHYTFPAATMISLIQQETGGEKTTTINATRIARNLLGDTIGGNLFLLGMAYQKGLVPVSAAALNRAIELNDVAVDFNKEAFLWGRRAAINPQAVEQLGHSDQDQHEPLDDLDAIIQWRADYLEKYQDRAYAKRYSEWMERVKKAWLDGESGPELCKAVARNYFHLLATKDEYEVARLFAETDFIDTLKARFDGDITLQFHLAPPGLARRDAHTGHLIKRRFPALTLVLFRLLARLRRLRGGALDIFGKSEERRLERQLRRDYETDIEWLINNAGDAKAELAIALAQAPSLVKGFGHIRMANMRRYQATRQQLVKKIRQPELTLVVNHPR